MRKYYFLVVVLLLTAGAVRGQNAIIGNGFAGYWNLNCSESTHFQDFSQLPNGTWSLQINATLAGTQDPDHFRLGIEWGGTIEQWTIDGNNDAVVNIGQKYQLNQQCHDSHYMTVSPQPSNTTDNYIFKTLDAGSNPTGQFVVFNVQGTVQSVTSVSQSPVTVEPNDDVTITANLSAAFATGQSAYLRYTIDNWATSTVVEMTGLGTTRTATIPSSVNGSGNTIEYYVFTSGAGLTIPGADADLFTINYNTNGGSNYSYSLVQNVDVFDDFQRITYGDIVGEPSSNPGSDWTEFESSIPSGARTDGGQLRMGSGTQGRDIISFDMTGHYPVAFDEATETMRWAVNMRSNRDNPSGFDNTYFGSAFILGSNKSDFTDSDASGYAVVLGSGTAVSGERPLRLVRFSDGLILNSNIEEIATVNLADDRGFLSVNVEYNSCSQTWTLRAREATSFSQPSIGAFPLSDTGIDNTYTSTEIPYLGVLWNHNIASNTYLQVDNIYIPESTISTLNQYTWIGGASGSFMTPTNWTPTRDCPRNRDRLIINVSADISDVPDQTIGQFIVRNNATVILRNHTSQTTSTLTLTGGPDEDFVIESGCTLNFNTLNESYTTEGIVIDMLNGTTGEIAGVLKYDSDNSSYTKRHQLFVTDADALHIKNGGRVEANYLFNSYHPFGEDRATDAVIFESGSTYLHASGANPFGYDRPDSKVVFEPGSWYEFTYGGGTPSMSGRTYGNFKYNVSSSKSMGGSHSYFIDTLIVNQGSLTFEHETTGTIGGDIEVSLGASLNFTPASGTAQVIIDAPVVQNIYGAGTLTFGAGTTLNLQNTTRINIQKNIAVDGTANVAASAVVDFEGENHFSGSGSTDIQDDSKVYLGSSGGIATSGNSGNVRTTSRTFSGEAAYIYDGTANQNTGTGLPVTLSGNGRLEIANTGAASNNTVTLTNNGTTTTPKLKLSDGLFAIGASNTVAISNNGSVESTAGNFAAGNLAGTVSFSGTGTVNASGNLDFWNVDLPAGSGGLDFGADGTPSIFNELVIGNNRYVENNGPFYENTSTLVYNTGGDFTAGDEWNDDQMSGRAIPYDVQVGRQGVNSTKMNFGSSNTYRYCRGDMNIGDAGGGSGYGFYLSNATGGDLKLDGDFIVNANGDFDANQSAVFFTGNTDQTITSHAPGNTVHFDYLIVDKVNSDLLLDDSPGTTVYAEGGPDGNVLVLSGGDLDLQGQTFYLGGGGPVLLVQNGNRTVKSATAATFEVIGPKEVQSSLSGALIFDNQVTVIISDGVNFGPDVTTINATLQIDAGGFANTNAPRYGPQSVLKYNTGSDPYWRRVEWSGTGGNAGYPNDVIVAGNTILSAGGDGGENTGTPFGARQDVTIEAGSAIYMHYGSDDMTVPLVVGRNLTINGSLSASDLVGGDIYVGGNWVRNTGGVFNPKDRQVLFNGASSQTITAAGGETFDYLAFANSGTKELLDDITVTKELEIESGSAALSGNGKIIHLLGNWLNQAGQAAFDETGTTVSFEGNSLQTVSCANSSFEGFDNVKIDNSGPGIKLYNNAAIYGNLKFVDGLIDATVNRVDFHDGATHSGAGDDSYINGYARKIGFSADMEFKFPVGQFVDNANPQDVIDVYQPAGLIPVITSTTASFTVDYHHESFFPGYTDPNILPPMQSPLEKVSTCNYWNINRTTTGTDAKIKLYWTDACLDINDPASLVVAKANGGQWESHGQSEVNSTFPYASGYVVSNVVSTFSPFAIGSESAINVLPIQLLSFTASAKNDLVETHWVTSTEINNAYFTVERSVDAVHFEEVGRVEGAGNSTSERSYALTDKSPYAGLSYYRLKQTDYDGNTTFSEVRSVKLDKDTGFDLIRVYRSVSGVKLRYQSDAQELKVEVFDMLGKRLYSTQIVNNNGRAHIYPSISRGIYLLRLSNGDASKSMKFFY